MKPYPNVKLILTDNAEYFKKTPLADWYASKSCKFTKSETQLLSHFIRLVTLWRGGGQYLDLNFILLKALDDNTFRNAFSYASHSKRKSVNTAAFHLSAEHPFILRLAHHLAVKYQSSMNSLGFGALVTNELTFFCGGTFSEDCSSIHFLPSHFLFPDYWSLSEALLQHNAPINLTDAREVYGIRMNYNLVSNFVEDLTSDQFFRYLTETNCPKTVSFASEYEIDKI